MSIWTVGCKISPSKSLERGPEGMSPMAIEYIIICNKVYVFSNTVAWVKVQARPSVDERAYQEKL
jgi:hypothetical protein